MEYKKHSGYSTRNKRISNGKRMQMFANDLSACGCENLAEVFKSIITTSPNYAAQIEEVNTFANDVVDVLNGLSFKDLEKFVVDHESFERAYEIGAQAIKVKNLLVIFDDTLSVVMSARSHRI